MGRQHKDLNKVVAWLNLTSMILQQVCNVLPATTLTQMQCKQVVEPCYCGGLPAARFMCSFSRAILQAPYMYFGLGITNLYHKQGIQHLLSLLHYGPNLDDNMGNLCALAWKINGQIFSLDWHSLHLLATPTWISHTWCFQTEYNIRIEMSTPEIPLLGRVTN